MATNKTDKTAYFAGGCFWCTEAVYKKLKGVKEVLPGYAGGWLENPTYEDVKTGQTGHAETVKIVYDPALISYEDLLEVFFAVHDPTQAHRQGADVGSQYRSSIFWQNEKELKTAANFILDLQRKGIYDKPVVTALEPFVKFYPAEEYHRNYFDNHPENPYCRIVIAPKIDKFSKRFSGMIKHGNEGGN